MSHIPEEWRAVREYNVASLRRAHAAAQTDEERARVVARADSMGVEAPELGAPDPTQLEDGEVLQVRSDGNSSACKCSGGSCSCRPVKRSDLTQESRADAEDRRDVADASLYFGDLTPAALDKARTLLGADRFAELQDSCKREWDAQQALAPTSSTRAALRGLMVATIAAAQPDLADRAATESTDWLHSQFAALQAAPSDNPNNPKERTDMAKDPVEEARQRELKRMRLASTRPLGRDDVLADDKLTPAQKARVDAAETAYDKDAAFRATQRDLRPLARVDATDDTSADDTSGAASLSDVDLLQKLNTWAKQNGLTLKDALEALRELNEIRAIGATEPRADSLECARNGVLKKLTELWKLPLN